MTYLPSACNDEEWFTISPNLGQSGLGKEERKGLYPKGMGRGSEVAEQGGEGR